MAMMAEPGERYLTNLHTAWSSMGAQEFVPGIEVGVPPPDWQYGHHFGAPVSAPFMHAAYAAGPAHPGHFWPGPMPQDFVGMPWGPASYGPSSYETNEHMYEQPRSIPAPAPYRERTAVVLSNLCMHYRVLDLHGDLDEFGLAPQNMQGAGDNSTYLLWYDSPELARQLVIGMDGTDDILKVASGKTVRAAVIASDGSVDLGEKVPDTLLIMIEQQVAYAREKGWTVVSTDE